MVADSEPGAAAAEVCCWWEDDESQGTRFVRELRYEERWEVPLLLLLLVAVVLLLLLLLLVDDDEEVKERSWLSLRRGLERESDGRLAAEAEAVEVDI